MSLISIPREKGLQLSDIVDVHTNIDVSPGFVWERVLAVAVRY